MELGSKDPRRAFGLSRVAFGVGLLVLPRVSAGAWFGRSHVGPGHVVLARAVGARDVALGFAVAGVDDASVRPWLLAGVVSDLGDVLAALAAARSGGLSRRNLAIAGAAAAGYLAVGAFLAARSAPAPSGRPSVEDPGGGTAIVRDALPG